jgi:hypothetical protein
MGGLWAKHMGLKRGAIGNTLGKHIGNLMGTHWELEGNMVGTKEFFFKSNITIMIINNILISINKILNNVQDDC